MKNPNLTGAQTSALQRYAREYGRSWKAALRRAWITGDYPGTIAVHAHLLQELRDCFGLAWLSRLKLPTKGYRMTVVNRGSDGFAYASVVFKSSDTMPGVDDLARHHSQNCAARHGEKCDCEAWTSQIDSVYSVCDLSAEPFRRRVPTLDPTGRTSHTATI